jgi:GNAT superfamily N-acetyltransferase
VNDPVEEVTAADVLLLRAEVLRPGLPLEESRYAQDESPDAHHLAVRLSDGRIVGCATFFPDPWEGPSPPVDGPAWRLRGMATAPEVRGTGAGGLLLERGLEVVAAAGAVLLWCNARTAAIGFYRRYGFQVGADEFPSGPHNVPHYRAWHLLSSG